MSVELGAGTTAGSGMAAIVAFDAVIDADECARLAVSEDTTSGCMGTC
jgi:hypothetical protein